MRTFLLYSFLLVCFASGAFAQEKEVTVRVTEYEGSTQKGLDVQINNKEPRKTNQNGIFKEYLRANEEFKKIEILSKTHIIKDFIYDPISQKIDVTVYRADRVLSGVVRNSQNVLAPNASLTIADKTFQKTAKTDVLGKFIIPFPAGYKPSDDLRFVIDGQELGKKQIKFRDDNFVELQKPDPKKAEKTKTEEIKTGEKPSEISAEEVKTQAEEKPEPKPAETNYVADIHKVTEELALEKEVLEKSSLKIQAQIQEITEKLSHSGNLNANVQSELKTELKGLELQLAENNKAYQATQGKTQAVIAHMKNLLTEIDSLQEATEERLQVVETEKEQQKKEYKRNLLIGSLIITFLLFLSFIFYFLYKRIKIQNNKISEQSEQLRKTNDQIRVQNQALELQKNIIHKKNQDITSSLYYAQRIQNAMLPELSVFQQIVPESFVFFQPREIVSGDFYWAYEYQNADTHKLVVSVVDCTGHGVPGAFMSLVGDALLNQIIKIQQIIEPDQILEHLNHGVQYTLRQQETSNKDGMDLALCVIDLPKNTLQFAGAKSPLLYIENGVLHEIKGTPMPIGGRESYYRRRESENIRFTQASLELKPNMVFYMFSDGFYDQFNDEGQKFLRKNFYQLLLDNHRLPFVEQKAKLSTTITDWIGNRHQIDDITVLGFSLSV